MRRAKVGLIHAICRKPERLANANAHWIAMPRSGASGYVHATAMGPVMFKTLKRFFAAHIVQDAPPELIACEFGCREGECRSETWVSCERRIRVQQSVETSVNPRQRRHVPSVPNKYK
jgi:hypothetical protein